jgi:amidohydrolase
MATNTLTHDIDEILPGIIADRRWLHENPELGFQETRTAEFIRQRLESLGVEDIRTGIAKTGITALVRGTAKGPGRCVLLRADIDALPIEEENDVDYRSQNDGVMHACGHDAHTAMLLGVVRLLMERRDQFSGTVKVLFQPSEEANGGGAKVMIDQGVLEDPHVDAVFGQHLLADRPTGQVWVTGGPVQASADSFTIRIQGKGGHGAMPETTVDPIAIGMEIGTALQSIVSRNVNPMSSVVVSVCTFHAGTASNIIPDRAELSGTVRTFTPENRDLAQERLTAIAEGIASAHRAVATVEYTRGYPPTVNDDRMADLVRQAAVTAIGEERVMQMRPIMPAEDFSYFLNERPGTYFMTGCGNEEKGITWPHHHPKFDIDEEALQYGIAVMLQTALDYLAADLEEGDTDGHDAA